MTSRSLGLSASLLMALVFPCFFWQEKLGLNLPLFSALVLGLLWYQHPQARWSPRGWLTLLGAFFSSVAFTWLSWNVSDARVARFLEENPHLIRKLHEVQ